MVLRRTRIKRFGVLSVATFFAVLGAIYGLIYGIIIAVGVLPIVPIDMGPLGALGVGIATVIFLIIAMAVGGFIGGAIVALVYNLIFAVTGGIEMSLDVQE